MHVLAATAASNSKRHGPYIISTFHCPSGPSLSDAEQSALAGDVYVYECTLVAELTLPLTTLFGPLGIAHAKRIGKSTM